MNSSGGYFLTRPTERPEQMAADLLPARLLSLSDCICDFIPDVWAIEWVNMEPQDRIAEAANFNVPPSLLQEVVNWTTERLNKGAFGWPCVFYTLRDAREFASQFLKVPDLRLLGIALHGDRVDDFVSKHKPRSGQGEPGIYAAVSRRQAAEPRGAELGWEVLCYDYGGFHSWLCNGLETEVAREFGIRPGAVGLIDSASDALTAADYCGREDVGAEPGFWAPWLVTEYSLQDGAAGETRGDCP